MLRWPPPVLRFYSVDIFYGLQIVHKTFVRARPLIIPYRLERSLCRPNEFPHYLIDNFILTIRGCRETNFSVQFSFCIIHLNEDRAKTCRDKLLAYA